VASIQRHHAKQKGPLASVSCAEPSCQTSDYQPTKPQIFETVKQPNHFTDPPEKQSTSQESDRPSNGEKQPNHFREPPEKQSTSQKIKRQAFERVNQSNHFTDPPEKLPFNQQSDRSSNR
jgi:hypothetical protein